MSKSHRGIEYEIDSTMRPSRYLGILGQIGYFFKAVVYGLLGYLCCKSGFGNVDSTPISTNGVFILLSKQPDHSGLVILSLTLCGLLSYSTYRITEGILGTGNIEKKSRLSNFFRFNLSPFVSSIMYITYAVYIISVLRHENDTEENSEEGFPNTWKGTRIGKAGLSLFFIAFVSASISQLIIVFQVRFKDEFKEDLNKWIYWIMVLTGEVGFFARSIVFALVAYAFVAFLVNDPPANVSNYLALGFQTLQHTNVERILLGILGVLLVIYSLFLLISIYARRFPTQIISRQQDSPV